MWSTALFAFALVGLVTLLALKSLEITRNTRTPLEHIRRKGDPLVRESLTTWKRNCRMCTIAVTRASSLWLKTTVHTAHLFFDRSLHAFTARLNRYLRGRRVQVRHSGIVSVHLKSVLEKTEEDSSRPDSL